MAVRDSYEVLIRRTSVINRRYQACPVSQRKPPLRDICGPVVSRFRQRRRSAATWRKGVIAESDSPPSGTHTAKAAADYQPSGLTRNAFFAHVIRAEPTA